MKNEINRSCMSTNQSATITFPVQNYPLKIIGENRKGFFLQEYVVECMVRHVPHWQANNIDIRRSAKGNYLAVNVVCDLQTSKQLALLVKDIKSHSAIRLVL